MRAWMICVGILIVLLAAFPFGASTDPDFLLGPEAHAFRTGSIGPTTVAVLRYIAGGVALLGTTLIIVGCGVGVSWNRKTGHPWYEIPSKGTPPKLEKALLEVVTALAELGRRAPRRLSLSCWYGFHFQERRLRLKRGKLRIKVRYHYVDQLDDGYGWAENVVDARVTYRHRMFLKCRYRLLNEKLVGCLVDMDKLWLLADVTKACADMTTHYKDEKAKRKKHREELMEEKLRGL